SAFPGKRKGTNRAWHFVDASGVGFHIFFHRTRAAQKISRLVMSLKSVAAKIFARSVVAKTQKWAQHPVETQQKVFENLIRAAKNTQFGKDHDFENIKTFSD